MQINNLARDVFDDEAKTWLHMNLLQINYV